MNRWSRSDKAGRLSRLLTDARFLAEPDCDEEAAPFWHVSMPQGSTTALDALRERFHNRLRRKPELRDEWLRLNERRSELEPEEGAQAHFECVTGHRVADFSWRRDAARQPLPKRRLRRVNGMAVAACLVAALSVSAVLRLTPGPPDPFNTETASLSGYRWDEVGERTRRYRATGEESRGGAVSYADAIAEARRARTVYLGFVERYDREGLMRARNLLIEARRVDTGYPEPVQVEQMAQVLDSLIRRTY